MRMTNTKQRILCTAIELFNKHSMVEVSVRHIADAIPISPGNLTYHFPNLDALLTAIHQQMVASMDQYYTPTGAPSVQALHQLLMAAYTMQSSYRFFFTNLASLSKRYPNIAKQHETIRIKRLAQTTALINSLVERGLLKQEVSLFHYSDLVTTIWLVYPAAIEQQLKKLAKSEFPLPVRLAWNMLTPHLTEKGMNAYNSLMNKETTDAND